MMRLRTFVALLLLIASNLSKLEAAETDLVAGKDKIPQDEKLNSHHQLSPNVLSKVLKESSPNFQKASSDGSPSSSGSFGTSLWGVFIYILIALTIFVAALIVLLQLNIFGNRPNSSKGVSKENLMNANNAPETRSYVPPSAAATSFDNPAMRYDNSSPAYPPQGDTSYQPYSRGLGTFSGQEASAPSSSYYGQASSPVAPVTPLPRYNSPPPNVSKSVEPDYYSRKPEEPYEYLDKYQPYTSQQQVEAAGQTDVNDLSTKRAVLRESTPYQVIEERVQGEDYDDTDTFVTFPNTLNPNPTPNSKPQLSASSSFNDGKNRLVRVLPRFHHVPSQQQMGGGPVPASSAVFQPVAPPPPPPQSQYY